MYTYYILYIANGAQPKVAGGGAGGGGGRVQEVPAFTVAGVRRDDSGFWRAGSGVSGAWEGGGGGGGGREDGVSIVREEEPEEYTFATSAFALLQQRLEPLEVRAARVAARKGAKKCTSVANSRD